MRLDSLKAHNFLTYIDFEYFFKPMPFLVQGQNLTDDGQTTNGTGKSGLMTIIEQCMTATNSRGVKDAELVRHGEKFGNIQLFASCDHRKRRLHIDYDIYVKGSNKLRLKYQNYDSDKWEDWEFSNMAHGKKLISEWFAIETEDLFNYYIINNTRFKSFYKSSNTDKVALINRFSDASIVDGIDKVDTTALDKDFKDQGDKVNEIKGKIEQAKEQLEKEQNRNLNAEKSEAEEEIEAQIGQYREEIVELNKMIPLIQAEEKGFNKTIQEKTDLKAVYDTEKKNIDTRAKEANKTLETAKKDLETASNAVKAFIKTDWKAKRKGFQDQIDEQKETRKTADSGLKEIEKKETQVLQILKEIETSLGGAITCPSCAHEFIIDGDLVALRARQTKGLGIKKEIEKDLEDSKANIEKIKTKVAEIEKLVSGVNEEERKENEEFNKLQTALNNVTSSLNGFQRTVNGFEREYTELASKENARKLAIETANTNISNIKVRIESVETEIKGCEETITVLETSKKNLKVNDNSKQIEEINQTIFDLGVDLEDWEAEQNFTGDALFKLNQWSKNFKNFRTFLANKSLEVMEYHCNRYLNEMGVDMTVKINGFKVLADGSVKDDITVQIIRNGLDRSFPSYSGGEKGRLLFASILANRFMINETHPYGGLDFLAIDEVLEGMDSKGFVSLLGSAKLLNIPVLLITHVTIEEKEDNVITIVKENGISRIK